MIDPSKLTEADKGRKVIYQRPYCDMEVGVLSSWNEHYVFVRFKGPGGEACEPEDVRFEFPKPSERHDDEAATKEAIDQDTITQAGTNPSS